MKEFLTAIIEARSAELKALQDAVKNETDAAKVDEMFSRAQSLEKELTEARSKLAEISSPKAEREAAEARDVFAGAKVEKTVDNGKDLKEGRSVTVASSSLVVPTHDASKINDTFNEVAHSLLDGVTTETFTNGDSYKIAYVKGYGEGEIKGEGVDYETTEPTFGYAEMNKQKITAYSEISREALKLPSADYEQKVVEGNRIALRKKLAKQVILGTGTNQLVGIFNAPAITADPVEISAIDENTLDEIIYAYGGSEDVEATETLILNKADLAAFAKLRRHDGEKTYQIETHGNWGFINGVHFVINSACPALSNSGTAANTKCMVYGALKNYTLSEFSPIELQKSDDYKFKQGMVAYRGDVMVGGNVTVANGFLIVKKVAA